MKKIENSKNDFAILRNFMKITTKFNIKLH